jgi:endonuclease-3
MLVAVMLSAQCTDARVNLVTKTLFKKYKTTGDFAKANLRELEREIFSTGFYREKAKHIKEACKIILEKHGGRVPDTMQELLKLPGVGRKTANIVLSNAFGKMEGIPVDTHVFRVSRKLGLSKGKTPEAVERDLMNAFPRMEWEFASIALIFHGRKVCHARKPDCRGCVFKKACPNAFK